MSINSDDTKKQLREYLALDDKVNELKAKIKTIEDRKKEISENILNTMQSNNIGDLKLSTGGSLRAYVQTTVNPLKKETIYKSLLNELSDEVQCEFLTDKILDKSNRGSNTKTILKRYKK